MKVIPTICLFLALLLAACSKEETTISSSQPEIESRLICIADSAHYQPDELIHGIATAPFINAFGTNGGDSFDPAPLMTKILQMLVNPRLPRMDSLFNVRSNRSDNPTERIWQTETYTFHYRSTSVSGEEITLSGRVTFPNRRDGQGHEVQTLSLCHHPWSTIPDAVPSLSLDFYPLRTLYNSAVIEPDYEGYGVSYGRTHPGLSFRTLPPQMSDCITAALEVMRRRGVTLATDGYSTNWGCSLGEPAAVAFSRYYDQEATPAERQQIRLHSTYASEGPLSPVNVYTYMGKHRELNAVLTHVMAGYLHVLSREELGGYEHKEFFPTAWQTKKVIIDGKEENYYDVWILDRFASAYYPTPSQSEHKVLANNFTAEMCTAEGDFDYTNAKTQAFMQTLERLNDWSGWIPVTPIYLAHLPNDELIPHEQAHIAYQQLAVTGGNVHWQDSPRCTVDLTSIYLYNHQIATIFDLLRIVCSEHPEDVYHCLQ